MAAKNSPGFGTLLCSLPAPEFWNWPHFSLAGENFFYSKFLGEKGGKRGLLGEKIFLGGGREIFWGPNFEKFRCVEHKVVSL